MNKTTWDELLRLAARVNNEIRYGRHSTSEEWRALADDLSKAMQIANIEADRLAIWEDCSKVS